MKGIIVSLFVVYAAVGYAQKTALVDECPKEQEDDWSIEWLIKHEDCNKFYKCTFGKPVEMKCPSDLWFNLETQQCDWKENVDCSDRNVPGEDTTPWVPPTDGPAPRYTITRPAPTFTDTTTEKEYTTSTEPPTPPTPPPTPEGSSPNTRVTTTTLAPPPTTTFLPSTTTTSSTTTSFPVLPNGCPADPHMHCLLPHETNCNAFYYCVWGQLVERNCPPTLHFNRVKQVCDWPWDAGCPASFNKHLDSRKSLR